MNLQEVSLETMLTDIGRAAPLISGSTAALIAAQPGIAMTRMALVVSHKHGSDTDLLVERLDSVLSDVKKATERDRAASSTLMAAYGQNSNAHARRSALIDATREPLAAAHLLVELLELLKDASAQVADNVASDFSGGIELIQAAFRAVMMAVENNLHDDGAEELRTRCGRSADTVSACFLGTIRADRSCGLSREQIVVPQ